MDFKFYIMFFTAFIPAVVSFIWYNPKVMGNGWISASGLDDDRLKNTNMALVFGLSYLFSLMLSFALSSIVIHQMHMLSVLENEPGVKDPNSEAGKYLADFMSRYGHNFRTFKHGAFHGTIAAIFFVLPIIGINALFTRRSAKYVFIHVGYWIISLALMGGVICAFV